MPLPPEEVARLSEIGPAAARLELATSETHGSRPDSMRKREVVAWIEAEEARLSSASEARREVREEESNSIARASAEAATEAAKAARLSARWALYAAIIAVVAAAISVKDQLLALVFGSP